MIELEVWERTRFIEILTVFVMTAVGILRFSRRG